MPGFIFRFFSNKKDEGKKEQKAHRLVTIQNHNNLEECMQVVSQPIELLSDESSNILIIGEESETVKNRLTDEYDNSTRPFTFKFHFISLKMFLATPQPLSAIIFAANEAQHAGSLEMKNKLNDYKLEIPEDMCTLFLTCNYNNKQICVVDFSDLVKKPDMKNPWSVVNNKDFSDILSHLEYELVEKYGETHKEWRKDRKKMREEMKEEMPNRSFWNAGRLASGSQQELESWPEPEQSTVCSCNIIG